MQIRAFTIRLKEEENKMLDNLKKELDISTDNGVIKHLINSYLELNNRYLAEKKSRNKAELKLSELQDNFEDIKKVFKLILSD